MYNRYIHSGGNMEPFLPLENTLEAHRRRDGDEPVSKEQPLVQRADKERKRGGLGKLLGDFRLDWDMGDILLILIVVLLFLDGEDDEMLLVLGLILFMGM